MKVYEFMAVITGSRRICFSDEKTPMTARTDTRYFHDFIQHRSEIRFVKGRLKFGNSKQAAPFPSMVVIFRGAGM